MPTSPPVVCPCGGLKIDGKCDRCGTYKGKHNRTTKERGYGWDWQQFVEQRKHDPEHALCQDCLGQGMVRAATERHHVRKIKDAPHLRLEHSNVRDLCSECHQRYTSQGL